MLHTHTHLMFKMNKQNQSHLDTNIFSRSCNLQIQVQMYVTSFITILREALYYSKQRVLGNLPFLSWTEKSPWTKEERPDDISQLLWYLWSQVLHWIVANETRISVSGIARKKRKVQPLWQKWIRHGTCFFSLNFLLRH